MNNCKCKNDLKIKDTQEDSSRKNGLFGASSLGTLPTQGLDGRLGSPRPQKVSLLHIRPIMASLMIPCLALPQKHKMSVLEMQKNFCKEKPQTNPLNPKRGEIKENRDGFMLIKIEIQMCDISDLPPDIIVCEFTQLTSKFCIILRDPQKNLRSSFFCLFVFLQR